MAETHARHGRSRLPRRVDAKALVGLGEDPSGSTSAPTTRGSSSCSAGGAARTVTLVEGDITDAAAVSAALDDHGITNVVHLAAMQVPFCVRSGARRACQRHGTVVVFEAIKARLSRIRGARVRELDGGLQRLRPLPRARDGRYRAVDAVRGVQARERGHGPRLLERRRRRLDRYSPVHRVRAGPRPGAHLGAVARHGGRCTRRGYTIAYGGTAQYDFAPDVGRAFALAARAATDGAHVANFPGVSSTMQEVVDAIESAAPAVAGRVFWEEGQLPFPEALEGRLLERLIGPLAHAARRWHSRHDRALPRGRHRRLTGFTRARP